MLFFSTFAFTSCEDEKENEQTTNAVYLPSKIYGDSGPVTFKYDDKNRITEVIEGETGYTITTTFAYNNNELSSAKIQEVTTEYTNTTNYTFTYQNNKVVVNYTYDQDFDDVFTDEFIIDANGKMTYFEEDNIFYDTAGNLTKVTSPNAEHFFEYDTKNGVFKNVKTPHWVYVYLFEDYFYYLANNCVKFNSNFLLTNESDTQTITYTYNTDNFPERIQFSNKDYYIKVEYTKK